MTRLLQRFRRRFHPDLTDEMREHLREKTEEFMSEGMDEEAARQKAQREFGNTTLFAEESLDEWTFPSLEAILQDLRYAARVLRKSPAFASTAILSLALGIGANAVIFTVIDHVLLRPLPYRAPEQLVSIWTRNLSHNQPHGQSSAADFFDWRAQSTAFASMSSYSSWPMNLTGRDEPRRLNGELVSANFFDTLGVGAAHGRTFRADEDQPNADFLVVLSDRLWRQFGAPADIIDATLTLNRSQAKVIGIMPANFNFLGRDTDFWTPFSMSPMNRANREGRWLSVVARLAKNASLQSAQSEMNVLSKRLAAEYPSDKDCDGALIPLHDELVHNSRLMMLALQGAVGLLLLITCANLANLLLARARGRSREMAVRAALGAGRGRIVRQLLAESGLLAIAGGALGLGLAYAGVRAIRTLGETVIPRVAEINLDTRVVLFTLLAAGFTALLFGLWPALHAARIDLRQHVYSAGRGTQRGTEKQRGLLVSLELALACILLVGASLLAESLARLDNTSAGFQISNVLTMQMTLPLSKYPTTAKQSAFVQEVLQRVAMVPGVLGAGETNDAPLGNNAMRTSFAIDGSKPFEMGLRFITPGYLRALGIPLISGRDFEISDTGSAPRVALVNQTAARLRWPDRDPVGQRLRVGDSPEWAVVSGIVADVKHLGLDTDEGPAIYLPYAQKPWDILSFSTLVIRTSGDPLRYAASVRARINSIDKDQPVSNISTLERALAKSTAVPLLMTSILSSISALALIMAVIGVYGVLAYAAAQQLPEIGIRLALGAAPRQILWMLLRQGMLRATLGIAVGLAGAWMLTRFLSSMLFGVQPRDPATFAAAAFVLFFASLAAVSIPARRALRIDPARALRAD